MKAKVSLTISIIFCLILSACGLSESNEQESDNVIVTYTAEIADSVVLDRLSEVKVEALNSETSELLLHDQQTNEMLVMNSEGSIISSFNPYLEGPDYMGNYSLGWSFHGKDQLVGFGYVHFVLFSKEGKRKQRLTYPIDVAGWQTMDYFPSRVISYESDNKNEFLALITGERGVKTRTQTYMDSADLVFAMNFEDESSRSIFRKPETSIYRTLGKYIDSGSPSMAHLEGSQFAVSYTSDRNIYIYDANTDELLNTLELPEAYSPVFEPVAFGSKDTPERTKVVAGVYGLGEYIVVRVMGRVPDSEAKIVQKIPRWWESPEWDQLQEKYGGEDLLLFNRDKFLSKLNWDFDELDYRYFGDTNGYLWVKRTYEDERDYQTFLKIKIVPETD